MSREAAERAVRDGQLDEALVLLQQQVREKPADAALRIFLFQLLCVLGQWSRALTQLSVAAELDASALGMAQMYREAVQCEALRREVFLGKKAPMVLGEPDEWLALLIESLLVGASGESGRADALRAKAFELAPSTAGTIDGAPFEWIADADMRLGPVCEAIINGRYYWLPFSHLSRVDIEAPADLRDFVWMPAHFQFSNGGEGVGLIPTCYQGSHEAAVPALRLGRQTQWIESGADVYTGLGQRVWATDGGEYPLMEVRELRFGTAGAPAPTDADA